MKDNQNIPNEQEKKRIQQPGDDAKKQNNPTNKSSKTPENKSSSDENEDKEESNDGKEFRENDQSKKIKSPEAGDDARRSL